jgi:hypothetical protein
MDAPAPLYPATLGANGVGIEPVPALRKPWGVEPRRYRHEEIVVLRLAASGELRVVESWPAELPPVPDGEQYAPLERLRDGGPRPEHAALDDPRVLLPWWR